jgi:hypothetical protein
MSSLVQEDDLGSQERNLVTRSSPKVIDVLSNSPIAPIDPTFSVGPLKQEFERPRRSLSAASPDAEHRFRERLSLPRLQLFRPDHQPEIPICEGFEKAATVTQQDTDVEV